MKKFVAAAIALFFLAATGCASTIRINSQPPGAKVYVDGAYIGKAPASYTDMGIVGTTHSVKLELPGYQDQTAMFSRSSQFNAGACLGGVFFLVPFIWILDYPSFVTYELEPLQGVQGSATTVPDQTPNS